MAFPAQAQSGSRPQRIVSTNYCTDQILMRLVEPSRIRSLTYFSWDIDATPNAYLGVLHGVKKNHGLAEEVLIERPDLVVGGTFSSGFASALLSRLGYKVLLFAPETSFAEWYVNVRALGAAVGEPERAERLIADFQMRLARLRAQIPAGPMPIFADLQVNNWMPGAGTFYAAVVNAGGFRTVGQALGYAGYRNVPLEQLIQLHADLISSQTAYEFPPSLGGQQLRHPLLRRMARDAYAAINIPARYVSCPTPETLEMVGLLAQARRDVDAARTRGRAQ